MMSGESRWAVLVGIDHYGPQCDRNLQGCANDALLVCDFLHTHLNVPSNQIFLHIARDKNLEPLKTECKQLEATPGALKDSIDRIIQAGEAARKNNEKAFVHVHFSGHGDTQNTVFCGGEESIEKRKKLLWLSGSDLTPKQSDAKDEVLCFPGGNVVTDVEFGAMLKMMAETGLTVSVTIDCCFAGGTTRYGEKLAIRCMSHASRNSTSDSRSRRQNDGGLLSSHGHRYPVPHSSFLDHKQHHYNAIMACQADQKAAEGTFSPDAEKVYGAFTFIAFESLNAVASQRNHITYKEFENILKAVMRESLSTQTPVFYGPDNRILFDYQEVESSHEATYVRLRQGTNTAVINKGKVTGVREGDVYRLSEYRASDTGNLNPSMLVKVTRAHDFESEVAFHPPRASHEFPSLGYSAQLTDRVRILVSVIDDGSDEARQTIGRIKNQWAEMPAAFFELKCLSDSISSKAEAISEAELQVHITKEDLEIRDSRDYTFQTLQKISVNDPKLVDRLKNGLKGMHNFQHLLLLQPPTRDRETQPFEFELTEPADVSDESPDHFVVAQYGFKFRNTSRNHLYFIVFHLDSDYGITIVYPDSNDDCRGISVASHQEVQEDEVVKACIPTRLLDQFESDGFLYDRWKVFVSTEEVDMRCLQQENGFLRTFPYPKTNDPLRYPIKEARAFANIRWWILDQPLYVNMDVTGCNKRARFRIPPVRKPASQ